MYETLIALEHSLDRHLGYPRVGPREALVIPPAAARWSAAVWTAAAAEGPVALGRAEVSHGLEVARRPIFICGAHRSGTTLVRDLLDHHPALAVLPSEGTFLTSSRRVLRRLPPQRRLEWLGCEWLRRLANPIHQAPYWVLGRSSRDHSPYVTFARYLMAWWPVAKRHVGATTSSWPLTAIALAYAQCTRGLNDSPCVHHWAEKSPTNERFLAKLGAEFPRGRIVHVIRHPLAVLASHEQEMRNAGGGRLPWWRIARDLDRSYRIATRHGADDRYFLVRYEELLEKPRDIVERLACFLGIEPLPSLLQPTVAGLPALSNSSFHRDPVPGRIQPQTASQTAAQTAILGRAAREHVAAVLGDAAAQAGYRLEPVACWRRTVLRFATRLGVS